MYATQLRYEEPRYNEILAITKTIQRPRYIQIPRYNEEMSTPDQRQMRNTPTVQYYTVLFCCLILYTPFMFIMTFDKSGTKETVNFLALSLE